MGILGYIMGIGQTLGPLVSGIIAAYFWLSLLYRRIPFYANPIECKNEMANLNQASKKS